MNYFINSTLAIAMVASLACQTNTSSAQQTASLYEQGQTPPGGRRVVKSDAEWKKQLTPDQYEVLRKHGTERPGTSPLLNVHEDGTFLCAACKNPLFSYKTKFESGTGWPSFYEPISKNAVKVAKDNSYGMERDEVVCAVCDGHLGHVFNDGPKPTGLRYCMNGVAMTFQKK
ncbi:peptide-methionine (R)-S-oxide reductase MsrB [Fibrella sp. WM1]|uniref:peptide-methionine (R)-S-oxide reductase MsrB n=1 Tax=Fibrella musci TaxID=3242485 RepID=UPI0035219E9C